MASVASRELRNQTRSLLDRVAGGEEIVITVDGRPMAVLAPLPTRDRWMSRETFARIVLTQQADSGLRQELSVLSPDMTDELPL
ncbi:MAG: type II toxin-antitoxin system prevent-host-death family antitoxin [Microthrixaceae bacterium]